jgi:hypothetical protein
LGKIVVYIAIGLSDIVICVYLPVAAFAFKLRKSGKDGKQLFKDGKQLFYAQLFTFYFLGGLIFHILYGLTVGEHFLYGLINDIILFGIAIYWVYKLLKTDENKFIKREQVYLYAGMVAFVWIITAIFLTVLPK